MLLHLLPHSLLIFQLVQSTSIGNTVLLNYDSTSQQYLIEATSLCDLASGLYPLPPSWECNGSTPLSPTCEWEGISCQNNLTIGINLRLRNISGNISPSIGNLTSLLTIDLSGNTLTGSVPDSICQLHHLQEIHLCSSTSGFNGCPYLTSIPLCLWDIQAGYLTENISTSVVFPQMNSITIGSLSSIEASVLCQLAIAIVPSPDGTICSSKSKLPKTAVCAGRIHISF